MTPFGDLLVQLGYVTADQVREVQSQQGRPGYRLGEALLAAGYITRDQLQHALVVASEFTEPIRTRPQLGRVLVELDHLDPKRLDAVLDVQRRDPRPLGELLVETGDCTYQQVFEALTLQQHATRETPAPTAVKGLRVLVVDDSTLVCTYVSDTLRQLGYEVTAMTDPQQALGLVATVKPDMVVTDLDMPGMTGIELCSRIKRASRGRMPVIIMTGSDGMGSPSAGLRAGADDYVRKGTSIEELAARIDNIVARTTATERMRRLFARYTSDAVVDEVLRAGDVVLTGEQREVTVVFADIRNFTSVAESLAPERVMAVLNDVLGRLADAVLACAGTLDKFLGDGVMAVFGAPVSHDDDTQRALASARRMLDSIAERNRIRGDTPLLEVGIGLNTGLVVAGSLGNERRTEYTCIGDTVNVAARLCALADPGQILVGPGTAHRLGTSTFDALPEMMLKGKSQPISVFRARR